MPGSAGRPGTRPSCAACSRSPGSSCTAVAASSGTGRRTTSPRSACPRSRRARRSRWPVPSRRGRSGRRSGHDPASPSAGARPAGAWLARRRPARRPRCVAAGRPRALGRDGRPRRSSPRSCAARAGDVVLILGRRLPPVAGERFWGERPAVAARLPARAGAPRAGAAAGAGGRRGGGRRARRGRVRGDPARRVPAADPGRGPARVGRRADAMTSTTARTTWRSRGAIALAGRPALVLERRGGRAGRPATRRSA